MINYIAIAPFAVPILIVAIVFAFKAYELRLKHSSALDTPTLRRLDDLTERIAKIERRMANLETIVLDTEKKREFDRAL